jgi:hypothetical protein
VDYTQGPAPAVTTDVKLSVINPTNVVFTQQDANNKNKKIIEVLLRINIETTVRGKLRNHALRRYHDDDLSTMNMLQVTNERAVFIFSVSCTYIL